MRKFVLGSLAGLVSMALALFAGWRLATDDRPLVERPLTLSVEQVGRAKDIVQQHRYRVRPGGWVSLHLSAEDADTAAGYLAQRYAEGNARLVFGAGAVRVQGSFPVRSPESRYLNVDATLVATSQGMPVLRSLSIGRLRLPDAVTNYLVSQLPIWLGYGSEYRSLLAALGWVRFDPTGVRAVYQWQPDLIDDVRAVAIDAGERERLLRYQSALAALLRDRRERSSSVSELLGPLLGLAERHSASGDARAENRAAILIAMFHAIGKSPRLLWPKEEWPDVAERAVTLDRRADLAKHFLVSAAIAAYADTRLADVVGLYKEVDDSQYGSGFSFDDLAADRAGTRFGEAAVADGASAHRIQRRAQASARDADWMPAWSDLPVSMSEAEFRRRTGGVDAPAYRDIMGKIERRVEALPVIRR
ncbi:MAG: hypothetical protein IOMNBAOH_00901 [Rhodocyclaceae bacterium]|nr:hypothetical protein [Rhodocyclaceae bacterium]